MNGNPNKFDVAPNLPAAFSLSFQTLLNEIKVRWDQGETVDTWAELAQHPQILQRRSCVLELAYEEYCQRKKLNHNLDSQAFLQRFPSIAKSLGRLLEVHHFLEENNSVFSTWESCWPEVNQQFMGFELQEELGRGAWGRVFLAQQPALGQRKVAVKIARQGAAEAEKMGRLSHPHVMPVYSVQQDSATGLTAICMPFLGRFTLCDVLDVAFGLSQTPLNVRTMWHILEQEAPAVRPTNYVDQVVKWGLQCADALVYTHRQGLLHRDLKPSNILLAEDGRAMLLDFNAAAAVDDKQCPLGGTLLYMPPEQLQAFLTPDHPPEVDERADIYSLGVVLYELLTNELPFSIPSNAAPPRVLAQELLTSQQTSTRNFHRLERLAGPALARTVEQCLAFQPADRFQSAKQLQHALQKHGRWPGRLLRWSQAHPYGLRSLCGIALLLAVCCGLWLANLPPYAERQYQLGWSAYADQNYEAAVNHFTNSIQGDFDRGQALFARGRAYLKLGEKNKDYLILANQDFTQADELSSDPRIAACRGFYHHQLGKPLLAYPHYKRAVQGGFQSAALLCNLGYSCSKTAKLQEAEEYLDQAIQLNPHLQAAWFDRGLLHLDLSVRNSKHPIQHSLRDFQQAIAVGPEHWELYRMLAFAQHVASANDPAFISQAQGSLMKALELGMTVEILRRSPDLYPLVQHLSLPPPSSHSPPSFSRIVDPLESTFVE